MQKFRVFCNFQVICICEYFILIKTVFHISATIWLFAVLVLKVSVFLQELRGSWACLQRRHRACTQWAEVKEGKVPSRDTGSAGALSWAFCGSPGSWLSWLSGFLTTGILDSGWLTSPGWYHCAWHPGYVRILILFRCVCSDFKLSLRPSFSTVLPAYSSCAVPEPSPWWHNPGLGMTHWLHALPRLHPFSLVLWKRPQEASLADDWEVQWHVKQATDSWRSTKFARDQNKASRSSEGQRPWTKS